MPKRMRTKSFRLARCGSLMMLSLWLALPAARADELGEFHAAIEIASAHYRAALLALETQGPDETAAEVERLRTAWHEFAERFGRDRPTAFADDDQYGAMFTVMDTEIVGALIVINAGRQEGARKALGPIGETLARLSAKSAGR
jgi:hypothetical protein